MTLDVLHTCFGCLVLTKHTDSDLQQQTCAYKTSVCEIRDDSVPVSALLFSLSSLKQ